MVTGAAVCDGDTETATLVVTAVLLQFDKTLSRLQTVATLQTVSDPAAS